LVEKVKVHRKIVKLIESREFCRGILTFNKSCDFSRKKSSAMFQSFTINARDVGKLIGRDGATINKFRRDFHVSITIIEHEFLTYCMTPEAEVGLGRRAVAVKGAEENVKEAIKAIQLYLNTYREFNVVQRLR
jgi:KH domain